MSIILVKMELGMSNLNTFKKKLKELGDAKQRKQQLYDAKEWYTIRAILGNQ